MPRVYRRRIYRRRRGSRTLSTRNIYSRTSAKSQAKQIAALRRRVTRVTRAMRPEIKVFSGSDSTFDFNMSSGALSGTPAWIQHRVPLPATGSGEGQRIGDKIFVKDLWINVNLEYYNTSTTGYHDSESSGSPIRFILLRTVGPVQTTFTYDIDNLLMYSGNTGGNYSMRSISPFKSGVTTQFTILKDFLRNVTVDRNQLTVKLHVRNQTITWTEAGLAHQFILYIVPAGLHSDANFTEYVRGHGVDKLAYTDA